MSPLSRRQLFGVVGAAGATAAGAVVLVPALSPPASETRRLKSTAALPPRFSRPLPIPPTLRPDRRTADTDYYTLTARESVLDIVPGAPTPIRGYNGMFPGPTIESRRGRQVVVTHHNELAHPTVVHLHGGRTPHDSDGYPTDLILPPRGWVPTHPGDTTVGSRDYTYPLAQRAAGLWYHDHWMDFTGASVWAGLAGMHLHRDNEETALPLPDGDREIPLMITDRAFAQDGTMPYPSRDTSLHQPGVTDPHTDGVFGDTILVNGAPTPYLEVEAVRYRFRILNASNARNYRLTLDPAPEEGPCFTQIGSDGGLLAAPQSVDSIYTAPAERFDVIIDFSAYRPGQSVTLTNRLGEGPTSKVMQFRVTRAATDDSHVPDRLSVVERLDPADAVRTRTFDFTTITRDGMTMYAIGGRLFDTDYIAADPALGSTEIWEFTSPTQHPVHIHLNPHQVLARDGGLKPEDHGWKDTVRLTPHHKVRLIIRFEGYRGRYVLHCHNLEHEDMGMMANFDVI